MWKYKVKNEGRLGITLFRMQELLWRAQIYPKIPLGKFNISSVKLSIYMTSNIWKTLLYYRIGFTINNFW